MKKILATTAILTTLALGGAAVACPHSKNGQCKYKHHGGPMKEMLADFPAEKADLIKGFMDEMRESREGKWEMMKGQRDELRALLTAETFDKEAYMKKAEEVQAVHSTMKLEKQERMADLASQLSAEEREVLAKMIDKKKRPPHHEGSPHNMHGK